MTIIDVRTDSFHPYKQHQLQQQHIHDNRSAVQLNQVHRLFNTMFILTFFHLVESMCAANEENNKKNVTNECSESRVILYVILHSIRSF